jgi:hypothetical protein
MNRLSGEMARGMCRDEENLHREGDQRGLPHQQGDHRGPQRQEGDNFIQ